MILSTRITIEPTDNAPGGGGWRVTALTTHRSAHATSPGELTERSEYWYFTWLAQAEDMVREMFHPDEPYIISTIDGVTTYGPRPSIASMIGKTTPPEPDPDATDILFETATNTKEATQALVQAFRLGTEINNPHPKPPHEPRPIIRAARYAMWFLAAVAILTIGMVIGQAIA